MWYNAGTITATAGSQYVDGQGTSFVGPVQASYGLLAPDGRLYEILQVISATRLQLVRPYAGGTVANVPYDIVPMTIDLSDLIARAQALVDRYQAFLGGVGQGIFQPGTAAAPGIRGVADQDTGLRWVSDNVLALVSGGVDALTVNGGNIGIGVQPLDRAHVKGVLRLEDPTDSTVRDVQLKVNAGGDLQLVDSFDGTVRMTATWNGLVGIGTSSPTRKLHIYAGAIFNQTPAGAAYFYGGNADGVAGKRYSYMSLASGTIAWGRATDDLSTVTEYGRFDQSGNFIPGSDNTLSLGTGGMRFSVVYAGSGSINTSDERAKQQIGDMPDAWLDAWGDVEWVRYKFNDAVQAKGDEARWHFGLIAQQVRDAFSAHGLDARTLGLLCHDEWAAIPAIPAVEEERDEAGEILTPASPAQPGHEAGERWGLRYDECQAIEAAYQRRRIAQLEAAVAALSGQRG